MLYVIQVCWQLASRIRTELFVVPSWTCSPAVNKLRNVPARQLSTDSVIFLLASCQQTPSCSCSPAVNSLRHVPACQLSTNSVMFLLASCQQTPSCSCSPAVNKLRHVPARQLSTNSVMFLLASYQQTTSYSCSPAVNKLRHVPARKLSTNLYDIYHCCVYSEKTPDDGQKNSPKPVELYSKNKFEKLVHLVGFIITIYHDARSPERQISASSWFYYNNLSRCTVT